VRLTLGARYQRLKQENFAYNTSVPAPENDEQRLSPMVGLVYQPFAQWSIYANYIEGLTQGDTASGVPPPVNSGEILDPYVTRQKEAGIKYDGGRFAVSAALFSTARPRSLITPENVFTSQGEDRHQGLEIQLQGEASRSVRILGGATWLRAEQESTGVAATNGKDVIGVPRFQANLGLEWDVPGVPDLTLDGRVVHTGSSHVDAANTLEAPSWTRLDLGMRYFVEIGGQLMTLRARVDNVTDRAYWASTGGFPGSGYLVVGAPRTFALSASIDF
jgi:iron complex outermembrane receptor protein